MGLTARRQDLCRTKTSFRTGLGLLHTSTKLPAPISSSLKCLWLLSLTRLLHTQATLRRLAIKEVLLEPRQLCFVTTLKSSMEQCHQGSGTGSGLRPSLTSQGSGTQLTLRGLAVPLKELVMLWLRFLAQEANGQACQLSQSAQYGAPPSLSSAWAL